MILSEILLAHKMLKEKTEGNEYIHEWLLLLKPTSWKIFHMRNVDQKEWKRITTYVDPKMTRKFSQLKEYIKIDNIQKENAKKLKKLVSKAGCITISKFGIIASHCAWLIVQHSDNARDFQNKYLKLMEINKEDVNNENIKFLRQRLGF